MLERSSGLVLESNDMFEQSLTPLGHHSFRIGEAAQEVARFDVIIEGRAQRATIAGGTYARVEGA